jgi:hypothetical protein
MLMDHGKERFYRPRRDGNDSVTWRGRVLFLECARRIEPNTIDSLRDRALPLYMEALRSPAIYKPWLTEWATIAGARADFRPQLIPFRQAILSWANDHQLQSARPDLEEGSPACERRRLQEDWLLVTALTSVRFWHEGDPRLAWTFPLPAQRFLFNAEEEKLPWWELERLAKKRRGSRVPEKRGRRAGKPVLHFEWLALHHLRRSTYSEIAQKYSNADHRAYDDSTYQRRQPGLVRCNAPIDYSIHGNTVAVAVRKTAAAIGLTLSSRFSPYL